MLSRRDLLALFAAAGAVGVSGCAAQPFSPRPQATARFDEIPYATWNGDEPPYRLYPGDQVDLVVNSAPELNRPLTVAPDGRVSLPLIGLMMVADRSIEENQQAITRAYASQLLRPEVELNLRTPVSLRVFVGGEVRNPGVFDMAGDIDTLQAVLQAGGFTDRADRRQVILIRRGADGRPMSKLVNLLDGVSNAGRGDYTPLRRFDVVYVPRTRIAEIGLAVQQYLRDALPVQVGFSYALNGQTIIQ